LRGLQFFSFLSFSYFSPCRRTRIENRHTERERERERVGEEEEEEEGEE
jgi:hypothetical protein